MKKIFALLGILVAILASVRTQAFTYADEESRLSYERWRKVKAPTGASPEAVGSFSAGCLLAAKPLPLESDHHVVMRTSRARYFGHPKLIAYIEDLGLKAQSNKLPKILIGDMSPPRGGPMFSGHSSHQTGLDVDIWFDLDKKTPTKKQRETRNARSYVIGRKKVNALWKEPQVKLLSLAAESPDVDRIFVSPGIKKYFCDHFADSTWQYRLRPWWKHDDHFHVRLSCPENSKDCTPQTALDPKDNGCGENLSWWLSEEADLEWIKISKESNVKTFPKLPDRCEQFVQIP